MGTDGAAEVVDAAAMAVWLGVVRGWCGCCCCLDSHCSTHWYERSLLGISSETVKYLRVTSSPVRSSCRLAAAATPTKARPAPPEKTGLDRITSHSGAGSSGKVEVEEEEGAGREIETDETVACREGEGVVALLEG